MSNRLRKYLFISIGAHFVLLFFIVLPKLDWFGLFDDKPKKITYIVLSKGDGGNNQKSNFKKADGMPDATIKEQKEVLKELAKGKTGDDRKTNETTSKNQVKPKEVTQKTKTSETGGINLDKKNPKTKTDSTIDNALSRIDSQLKQRDVQITAAQTKEGESGQSPWGSDQGSNVDPQLVAYFNIIKKKIRDEWVTKENFSGSFRVKIVVRIDQSGNIIRTNTEKPSGDTSFDESAMRALKRAAPFPTPPDSIKDEVLVEGFEFEFKPGAVTGSI